MDVRLEPLTFEQAVEFFKDKVVLPPREFERLWGEYKNLAFTVSGIAVLDVLKDIYEALLRAIEDGRTQQEFAQQVNEILENRGWKGLAPYRLDNIFRTNIQTAYNVGHYRRLTDPEMLKARPYWMYDAVNDSRTRPTHRALDGKVFPADHPFWDTWYPPNGYRCRCGVISLSEAEVRRRGLTVEDEIPGMVEPPGQVPRPLVPDPGFAHNPAKVRWQPDLSGYPEPLRQALITRAKAR